MTQVDPPRRSRRLLPVAGFAVVLLFLGIVGRFWHPVYGFTAFFQLDASNDDVKLQAFRDLPVYVYRDTGGYDGLYYAQIALDPSLHDPQLPKAIDNFSYRARRILPSALAWAAGLGRAPGIILAYSLLNVVAWLGLAVLLWRALPVRDVRTWFAWFAILFSTGALFSVRLALTDLAATALLTLAVWAAERERKRGALIAVAAAALTRETAILGLAGLVKPPWFSLKNVVRAVLATLPLVAWMLYIRWQVGAADQGLRNFNWPVLGWVEKWQEAVCSLVVVEDRWLTITSLLALVGITTQAVFVAVHRDLRDRWWQVGAVFAVLMLFLGPAVWEGFPGAATRVLLPLTVAFNVLASRRQAALAWLVLGNLGILSGLLSFRDIPRDGREVASYRDHSIAAIARVGDGWFGRERLRSHTWQWMRGDGVVEIETWPRSPATVRFSFGARSVVPRTVVLRDNKGELWRGMVGTSLSEFGVEVPIREGHARLTFSTDGPGVPESDGPEARFLTLALYDPRLSAGARTTPPR